MDYIKLLTDGFNTENGPCIPYASRLDYLGSEIFDITTYDSSMTEKIASKLLETIKAITERTTFEYIKIEENYHWYLLMVNMPFFQGKLNWGCSIRGAWWDLSELWNPNGVTTFTSCGLYDGDQQVTELKFSTDEEWVNFMKAVIEFAEQPVEAKNLEEKSSE